MITVAVTTAIAAIVMKFSEIDYTFMDYLQQPFDPVDAGYIFLSELLIGCLGAIMDVVVTVIMTVNQMISHTPDLNSKTLIKSCRNVGDDVVGTMINIMFFYQYRSKPAIFHPVHAQRHRGADYTQISRVL